MINKSITITLFIVGILLTFNGLTVCQTADKSNDGPHIYWQNDSTALVFYFCESEIVSKEFIVKDRLQFNGFCDDIYSNYIVPKIQHKPLSYITHNASKIFAISDIHGEYFHFTEILKNFGVIDSNLNWSFGNGHLVINGDLFDRGDKVTECLWLVYHLEREAKLAGGALHFILGNHELLALRGDLRYVNEKYLKGISKRKRFKYDELYGVDTEMGRWLRSKNTIELINGILFVHGGLSTKLISDKLQPDEINKQVRLGLDYSSVDLQFDDIVPSLYGSFGPLWYRGLVRDLKNRYDAATTVQVDSLLEYFNTTNIVVGHSQMENISLLHGGKVIAIDIIVEELGHQMALLWEAGDFYSVAGNGEKHQLTVK